MVIMLGGSDYSTLTIVRSVYFGLGHVLWASQNCAQASFASRASKVLVKPRAVTLYLPAAFAADSRYLAFADRESARLASSFSTHVWGFAGVTDTVCTVVAWGAAAGASADGLGDSAADPFSSFAMITNLARYMMKAPGVLPLGAVGFTQAADYVLFVITRGSTTANAPRSLALNRCTMSCWNSASLLLGA